MSSKLKDCISNQSQFMVRPETESEYDVYLVKIDLNKADERFKNNVNQIDRIDAFHQLANITANIQVSPRLQMEAYENTNVYNR